MPDHECPCEYRIKKLEENHLQLDKKIGALSLESRNNDKALTRLSGDLANHILKTDMTLASISKIVSVTNKSIDNLNSHLVSHTAEENKSMASLKDSIKKEMTLELTPIKKSLQGLDGIKIRQGIMWSIGISALTLISAFGLYVVQQKYTDYTAQEKLEYSKFKEHQLEKRILKEKGIK